MKTISRSLNFLLILSLLSCGTASERQQADNISFDLPAALTKAAAEGDLVARFIGTGAERKEVDLTIAADGKVSGQMTVKPGKWTFEVQFYQYPKSGGAPIPVAFFHFNEMDVAGEALNLTYKAEDLKFDAPEAKEGVITPSISPSPDLIPQMCKDAKKKYDCDGDGVPNFQEIREGTDPLDPNSKPVKPPVPAVTPPPPPPPSPKPPITLPPPPVVINRLPVFGGYLSSVAALVKDPKAGITLSWSQSDPDGDPLQTTVSIYRGSLCGGEAARTTTVKGSGKMEASLKDLEPRTDSSYNLLITDLKGGKALGDCRSFTTADTGLVGWWRFDEGDGGMTKDSSGNEHHGTLKRYSESPKVLKADETSAALVTSGILPSWIKDGISGGALQFDGTGTVEVPDPVTSNLRFGNGNFSTEVWFRIPKGQTILTCCETLIAKRRGASGWMMELRSANYNGAWVVSRDNDDNPDNGSVDLNHTVEITDERDGTKLNDGNWHQLVGVRDGLKGYAFLDGRLILSGASAELADMEFFYTSKEIPLRIGFSTGTRNLRGAIDEVAVYNRALLPKEIRQNCSRISGTTCNSLEPVPVNPIGNGTFAPDKDGKFPNVEWTTASEATYTWSLYKLPTAAADKSKETVVKENQTTSTPSIDLKGILDYRTSYLLEVKACDLKDPSNCVTRSWNFTTTQFGLVGWWRFDEGGGTIAKDSSGQGNHGTLRGTPKWNNGLLDFNPDTKDYVRVPDSDTLDSPKTVEIRFRAQDLKLNGGLVDKYNGAVSVSPGYFLSLADKIGRVDWTVNDQPRGFQTTILQDAWVHLVVVHEAGSQIQYINGQRVASGTFAEAIKANSEVLAIGANINGTLEYEFFKGSIDDVAIYNRPLTTTEIRASCRRNEPTPTSPTCAADDVPDQVTPRSGLNLPPTRAFLSWKIPSDKTKTAINHFEVCYSRLIDMVPEGNCDNFSRSVNLYLAAPLTRLSSYQWKVRTCYSSNSSDCSAYSPVWSFKTDDSLAGWWKFDDHPFIEEADPCDNRSLNPDGSGSWNFAVPLPSTYPYPSKSGPICDSSGKGNVGAAFDYPTDPEKMRARRTSETAVLNGITVDGVPGITGGALSLDGMNDYVDLDSSIGALGFGKADNYTMEARFRSNVSEAGSLITLTAGGGGVPGAGLSISGGNIRYDVVDVRGHSGHPSDYKGSDYGLSELEVKTTSGGLSDSIFHHAVGVYRGDSNLADDCSGTVCKVDPTPPQVSLFVDGNLKVAQSGTIYPFVASSFARAAFGKAAHTSSDFFNGLIDEIAIYKTNLSPEAVKNNYCALEALAVSDLKAKGCL